MLQNAVLGCLLGGMVGDMVGLAVEGLTPQRQRTLFGNIDGPRLLGRRGMVSDDTEHVVMVVRALIASGGNAEAFAHRFARELRGWISRLPAGVGWATLRAGLRLLIGISPSRSGVFSAGNGPAMRAALLGVCARDTAHLRALVRASTVVTHTDPKAEYAALVVATATRLSAAQNLSPDTLLGALAPFSLNDELRSLIERAAHNAAGQDTSAFAMSLGLARGVSGYALHSVPVAIHAALRYPADVRAAVLACVACGGDTDTTAAIVGGIVGAGTGPSGVPADWLKALWEWPQNAAYLSRLSVALVQAIETARPSDPPGVPLTALLLRNAAFTSIVLAHGLRRLLPPYK